MSRKRKSKRSDSWRDYWAAKHITSKSISNKIKMPVTVVCERDNNYCTTFELSISYDCRLDQLITDIIHYINNKYKPIKFTPVMIYPQSFTGQRIHYNDYDWNDCSIKVTDYTNSLYPKNYITQRGMQLLVDVAIYEHKTSSINVVCDKMKSITELCPIYAEMRYENIFSELNLNHLCEFDHDKIKCKSGDECDAYRRLSEGKNLLKDRCHVQIYRHPPRLNKPNSNGLIGSFCLNDFWVDNIALYTPTEQDQMKYEWNEENGYFKALIVEVVCNGFDDDLYFEGAEDEKGNAYSIMNVVNNKLNCIRHKQMGRPLNKGEMLSLLLYTGCDCNYDFSEKQRNGDYSTWKWFDYCLYHAIFKLSKREFGSYKIYTGLADVHLSDKFISSGYFKTYVSTSWIRDIALTFVEGEGMLFEINEKFRQNEICCDVSWISKFGSGECEILVARSVDAVYNHFKCEIFDQQNEIQTVLLSPYDRSQSVHPLLIKRTLSINTVSKITKKADKQVEDTVDLRKLQSVDGIIQYIVYAYIGKHIRQTYINNHTEMMLSKFPSEVFALCALFYVENNNRWYLSPKSINLSIVQSALLSQPQSVSKIPNIAYNADSKYLAIASSSLIYLYDINIKKQKWKLKANISATRIKFFKYRGNLILLSFNTEAIEYWHVRKRSAKCIASMSLYSPLSAKAEDLINWHELWFNGCYGYGYTFQVLISTGKTIRLHVTPIDTICSVCHKIQAEDIGIRAEKQMLLFDGKQAEKEKMLCLYDNPIKSVLLSYTKSSYSCKGCIYCCLYSLSK